MIVVQENIPNVSLIKCKKNEKNQNQKEEKTSMGDVRMKRIVVVVQ